MWESPKNRWLCFRLRLPWRLLQGEQCPPSFTPLGFGDHDGWHSASPVIKLASIRPACPSTVQPRAASALTVYSSLFHIPSIITLSVQLNRTTTSWTELGFPVPVPTCHFYSWHYTLALPTWPSMSCWSLGYPGTWRIPRSASSCTNNVLFLSPISATRWSQPACYPLVF